MVSVGVVVVGELLDELLECDPLVLLADPFSLVAFSAVSMAVDAVEVAEEFGCPAEFSDLREEPSRRPLLVLVVVESARFQVVDSRRPAGVGIARR